MDLTPNLQLSKIEADRLVPVSDLADAINDNADKLDAAAALMPASAVPVLEPGIAGQLRAGRVLALADFTTLLGLSAPAGLYSLASVADASGAARDLTNKGAVTFGKGILGAATEAAIFTGSTAQALYRADAGGADPFRIRTGSIGCWFRTAKRGTEQILISKWAGGAPGEAYQLRVGTTNLLEFAISTNGSTTAATATGTTDIADDRWHFAVATFDGETLSVYLDGVLEATATVSGTIYAASAPLNIGAMSADSGTAAISPHFGRIDEAFITSDVLSADQARLLYCAKVVHGAPATPRAATVAVRRRRRGGPLAVADFSALPRRLHNFTAGALTDAGTDGQALTNNNAAVNVAGADGAAAGAFAFDAASTRYLSATDTGLPSGTDPRTIAGWFKTTFATGGGAQATIVSYGTAGTGPDVYVDGETGHLMSDGSSIDGPAVNDGRWHHFALVYDNTAADGLKRKLYLDGRLVVSSAAAITASVLAGAGGFRIGRARGAGTNYFTGAIDGIAITDYAMAASEVAYLYAKGSQQLPASPKNAGDHVEAIDATNVYAVFDALEPQDLIDLRVVA